MGTCNENMGLLEQQGRTEVLTDGERQWTIAGYVRIGSEDYRRIVEYKELNR